jgi:Spy/CpxP family protein refolding chaperone
VTRTKILLVLSLAVVFAAGGAVGYAVRRQTPPEPPHERRRRSWLTDELNLKPEQREQMQEIWSEAMEPTRGEFGQRGRIYEERNEAVRALLNEDQQAEYDRILEETERRLQELSDARRRAFEEAFEKAVARTKEILTPEQRQKYEEMLSRMPEPGPGPGGRRGRGRGRPGGPMPPGPPDGRGSPPSRPEEPEAE